MYSIDFFKKYFLTKNKRKNRPEKKKATEKKKTKKRKEEEKLKYLKIIGNQFQVNTTNKSKMKPINQYLVFLCC